MRSSFISCLKDFPHLRNSHALYSLIFVGFCIFIGLSSRPISVFWITDFPFLSINDWPDSYHLSLLPCFLPLLSTFYYEFQLFGFNEGLVSIQLICTFFHPWFLNIKKWQGHVSQVCWNLRRLCWVSPTPHWPSEICPCSSLASAAGDTALSHMGELDAMTLSLREQALLLSMSTGELTPMTWLQGNWLCSSPEEGGLRRGPDWSPVTTQAHI